jgi:type VI secretion system secreted protein VgrG
MALLVDLNFPNHEDLSGAFEVHRVVFSDRMSDLFELHLEAFSQSSDIDPRSLLGERVDVILKDERILPAVHGMVRSAQRHTPEPTGVTKYEITVVPFEWLLGRARHTRIFQALTAPDIVAQVLSEHGIALSPPGGRLGPHAVREYTVQHEETDHDFIFRLLADDGTVSFHDHSSGAWVLADDTTTGALAVTEPIQWNASNAMPAGAAVVQWTETADVETAQVARRDYDYTKPNLLLQATAQATSPRSPIEASLEDYDYEVGAFADDTGGSALAKRRREAHRATVRTLHLVTNFAAAAGMRLSIQGLEQTDWVVYQSHFVLESKDTGKVERRCTYRAIPADVPYRPAPRSKPRIPGTQVAFVVGDTPAGTVDTDPLGRVKVEFRWDRRDLGKGNPTRWVRVAQAWAGPGYGLVTFPRVGDEVLIAYSEGDPDQPVVIGRMHNAVNVTPLPSPESDKTKAVWKSQSWNQSGPADGFNMILMNDAAGEEAIEIKAQLDYRADIGRDMSTLVRRNRATLIKGNDQLEVQGNSRSVIKGGSTSITGGDAVIQGGTVTINSKGKMKLYSGGDMTLLSDADRTDETASNHFVKAGSVYASVSDVFQINGAHFHVFATGDIRLISGGSSIIISPDGIKIASSGDVEINGGLVKLNCT